MNLKHSWVWVAMAVVLLGLTVWHHQFGAKPAAGLPRILRDFNPQGVASVTVRPQGQTEIRATRTNEQWVLTQPVVYPAQPLSIEKLLSFLETLTPAATITPAELKNKSAADEEYGFSAPHASVTLSSGHDRQQLLVGRTTTPGDQVYLQLVGKEEVHIVSAELLKYLPKAADDWRDTSLMRLQDPAFDYLSVANGQRTFELHRVSANAAWRMTNPIDSRADSARVEELLQRLETAQVSRFIADNPSDLESFGLQPPQVELGFRSGTNVVVTLQFGKSPTNDASQVFARRSGQNTIVTIPADLLAPWRGAVNDFRDPRLFNNTRPVQAVLVEASEKFSVEQTNGQWRVLPQDWPGDKAATEGLISALARMPIVEFTKDVVTPMDWANYGLATPTRRYQLLSAAGTNGASTNIVVDLAFGTNDQGRTYVRRLDEPSVYAVSSNDCALLPRSPLDFRERQIWDVPDDNVTSVTIRQQGKTRQLLRKAHHEWSLAPGSQGIINELAVEESVRPLCHLAAASWVAHGQQKLAEFGFNDNALQVAVELKGGQTLGLQFGNSTASGSVYAAVMIAAEPWIFEFPSDLWRFVATYLTIPVNLL